MLIRNNFFLPLETAMDPGWLVAIAIILLSVVLFGLMMRSVMMKSGAHRKQNYNVSTSRAMYTPHHSKYSHWLRR